MAILITEQVKPSEQEVKPSEQEVMPAEPGPHDEKQDAMVGFLEQHPAYYTIMKSALFIRILRSLSGKAKNMLMLKQSFPSIEQEDLMTIIEMFIDLGVVSYIDAGSNRFYYANSKGKEFLSVYDATRERFLGKEEPF